MRAVGARLLGAFPLLPLYFRLPIMRGRLFSASLPSALLLVGLFVLSGCSSNSFLGRRVDNFTAYYNTFYNAKKAYRAGVESLEREDVPVNRDAYLSVFVTPDRAGAEGFDDAVQKSADVLRDHDASKWADDALLLIGKSYFYLQNYVGAEQKFQEVIGLDGRFEDSPLKDEARFWLARTLIASGSYELAATHLEETLSRENLPRRWEGQLRLALGELHVKQAIWEAAAAELATGLDLVKDDELGGRAQFLYGQVQETMGDYEAAAEAFRRVRRYDPLFELSYAAQMSAIRVAGLHGNAEEALEQLRRMERDDKFYERRAELAYLRARVYQETGRPEEARALYRDLLYNSDANIQDVRGRIHYGLGELHRDAYNNYLLAAAHFDTAGTALSPNTRGFGREETALAFTAEAISDGEEQARVFGSFVRVEGEVSRMDSLLYLGGLDDAAFEERLLEIRRQQAEELAEQQRLLAERQAQQRFSGEDLGMEGEDFGGEFSRDVGNEEFDDSFDDSSEAESLAPTSGGTAGFLFHRSPVKVQEGRLLFVDEWGQRPLVPNWRRSAAIAGETGAVAAADKVEQLRQLGIDVDPEPQNDLLPEIDISGIPRDSVSRRAMMADRAMARYELANVLFLQMNRPDSAAAWYRRVIEEDTDEPVAQRAYYALAEVQQALGDTASAERLYRQTLEDDPNSDFAARIRERLGIATETDAGPDSTRLASDAYREAFRQWEQGRHRRALVEMLDVAARYRQTSVAPKALTAAGSIYAEWARRDRFDLFAARPLNVPDELLEKAGLLDSTLVASSQQAYPGNEAQPLLAIGVAPAALSGSTLDADPVLAPDSLASDGQAGEGGRASLQLETLYASIARNYPQSPYAARAEQVLATIRELQLSPLAATEDSSEALLAAKSTARSEEELSALERLRAERLPNQGEGAASAVVAEALSPLEAATMSVTSGAGTQGKIDPSRGGWTFVVASEGEFPNAEVALETYKDQAGLRGLPAGVLTTRRGGDKQYRAILGQFTSESEARMALGHFRRQLPEETTLLRLEIGEELPVAARATPEETPEQTSGEVAVAPEAAPLLAVSQTEPLQTEQPEVREEPVPDPEARPTAEDPEEEEALARAVPSQGDTPAETSAAPEAGPADADSAALDAKLRRELAELAALWERVAARTAQDSLAALEAEQAELLSKLEEARRELAPEEDSTTDPATLLSNLQREVEELEALRRARETSARGGINPAEGGWSIVIASGADSARVQAALRPYADRFRIRSIPTGIVASEADGAIRYRALAGQYTSRTAAQAALTWLADELPRDAWLLRLRPNR